MERQKKGIKLKGSGRGQNVVDEKNQIQASHLTVLYIHLMGYGFFSPFQTNASIMWEVSSNLGDSPKTGMNSF